MQQPWAFTAAVISNYASARISRSVISAHTDAAVRFVPAGDIQLLLLTTAAALVPPAKAKRT
jgi:hypothetical protein